MANNYEAMKLQMRDEFLKYDQAAMIEKFSLRSDDKTDAGGTLICEGSVMVSMI